MDDFKFPKKEDFIDNIDGYLEACITTCLTIHKKLVNDVLVEYTGGQMTSEQQSQYFLGKQLFSDEPPYALLTQIRLYRESPNTETLFKICALVDKCSLYVKRKTSKQHLGELAIYTELMLSADLDANAVAEKLCEEGWYNSDDIDHLIRNIHRWQQTNVIMKKDN